jgi:hypothetical protein
VERRFWGLLLLAEVPWFLEKQQFSAVRIAHRFVDFCNW